MFDLGIAIAVGFQIWKLYEEGRFIGDNIIDLARAAKILNDRLSEWLAGEHFQAGQRALAEGQLLAAEPIFRLAYQFFNTGVGKLGILSFKQRRITMHDQACTAALLVATIVRLQGKKDVAKGWADSAKIHFDEWVELWMQSEYAIRVIGKIHPENAVVDPYGTNRIKEQIEEDIKKESNQAKITFMDLYQALGR